MQDALPCIYSPRLEDGVLNQALLAGLELGLRLSTDDEVRARLQHLANFQLAPVSSVRLTPQLLQRAERAMTRLTATYAPALTLIRILLASQGMSLAGEEEDLPLPGFLFDMNRCFQDLLQRFLQAYLPDAEVVAQYEITDLFRDLENPDGSNLRSSALITWSSNVRRSWRFWMPSIVICGSETCLRTYSISSSCIR